jgi:peptidoglycan hydrolase CwlO-like protein
MTDDLVKRLRSPELYTEISWQELMSLAADRIEKLEAGIDEKDTEIKGLILEVDDGGDEIAHLQHQIDELECEIRDLRKGLK